MDGPEAWGANECFLNPTTFALYTFLPNPLYIGF